MLELLRITLKDEKRYREINEELIEICRTSHSLQEAEEGLFHELIKETSSHPPPVPFGEELVPPRFESYDTEPPGYLDPPPIEMLLDLERKFKDFTEIKISPELLELLKTLVIYPSCKSLREAAEILGWNEQQYQRAKKNLQRNRSLLASILKK